MSDGIRKVLEEVRQLDIAATAGPWDDNMRSLPFGTEHPLVCVRQSGAEAGLGIVACDADPEDAALIARYRTLAPRLAAALEVAVEELSRLCSCGPADWQDDNFSCCECDLLRRIAAALTPQGEGGDV